MHYLTLSNRNKSESGAAIQIKLAHKYDNTIELSQKSKYPSLWKTVAGFHSMTLFSDKDVREVFKNHFGAPMKRQNPTFLSSKVHPHIVILSTKERFVQMIFGIFL